eukprot:TRINITY_DN8472_c0_g1_i1.p1 TRINITY_DN8472_c0_g1~~TRINITY_DN8472_c0_g1_i1.p1  ORF type:complete len:121 (+),score=27.80 TRINITY_DN8472_c0_g1_i1:44-406(+)
MLPDIITNFGLKVLLVFYGYQSFKAVESDNKEDDTQWLTFWLIYSFIQFAEYFSDTLLFWIPFYNELKLGLFVFLGLFRGSALLYNSFFRDVLKQNEAKIDKNLEKITNKVTGKVAKVQD